MLGMIVEAGYLVSTGANGELGCRAVCEPAHTSSGDGESYTSEDTDLNIPYTASNAAIARD
jgi:hypothetical protein